MGRKQKPRSNKAGKGKQKIDTKFKCFFCETVFIRPVPKIGKKPFYMYCNRECEKQDVSDDFHSKTVRLQRKRFEQAKRLHKQASSQISRELNG